jgi:hypothetical protein
MTAFAVPVTGELKATPNASSSTGCSKEFQRKTVALRTVQSQLVVNSNAYTGFKLPRATRICFQLHRFTQKNPGLLDVLRNSRLPTSHGEKRTEVRTSESAPPRARCAKQPRRFGLVSAYPRAEFKHMPKPSEPIRVEAGCFLIEDRRT